MKFPKMPMKMNPIGFFADLMTSKYFLLFVALISAINIIGYISMGYMDAVMLFAMVAYLTFVFSKNMTVVLLVAVIVVNLYMHTMMTREGAKSTQRGSGSGAPTQAGTDIGKLEALTNKADAMPDDDEVEMQEPDVETTEESVEEVEEEEPTIKEGLSKKTNVSSFQNMSPQELDAAPTKKSSHIDYGTTLTDAYKNLEKMLGEGGLKNLTTDTKKLMEQQSKLFNSMENIAPLLADAQNMMKKMNMAGMVADDKKEGFWGGRVGGIADFAEEIHTK
jgi:hypothetical protein